MKTTISLPDATFEAASRRVVELGISRSQFFAMAARRYLDELNRASVTAQINEALTHVRTDDSSAAAVAAGRAHVSADGDW